MHTVRRLQRMRKGYGDQFNLNSPCNTVSPRAEMHDMHQHQ